MIVPGGLMVRLLGFLMILIVLAPSLFASVATLASLEGEVTVLRSGVLIPSEKVTEGFLLEAFDTVTTGATGRAEIRLAASGVVGALRLDAGTSLYLDMTSQKKEQTIGVELLTGSLSVRVSAATGASVIEVRTDAGSFYGAGPSFRVVGTSAGDVLVTSAAGRVVCRVGPRTVFIEPGSVLQALTLEQTVQTIPMNVSTLEAFEGTWVRQRQQNFRDQAAVYFRALAGRYQLQVGLFQRAWDRVQREGSETDKALRAATANLRRAAFPLERSLPRIKALRSLLEEGGLSPSVELSRGYAAREFFRQTGRDEALWTARLGEARGLYRSLADKSGGVFPKASDSEVITWDSDYFH